MRHLVRGKSLRFLRTRRRSHRPLAPWRFPFPMKMKMENEPGLVGRNCGKQSSLPPIRFCRFKKLMTRIPFLCEDG